MARATDECLYARVKLGSGPASPSGNLLELALICPLRLTNLYRMQINGSKASSNPTMPTIASADKDIDASAFRW